MNVFQIIPFNFISINFIFLYNDDWAILVAQCLRLEFNIQWRSQGVVLGVDPPLDKKRRTLLSYQCP
jgi:hypothetical protein